MEENEALLEREQNFRSHRYNGAIFCDSQPSSSDESIGWLAESQSSCNTSCSGIESFCSVDWESEVNTNGEIFYVESGSLESTLDTVSKPTPSQNEETGAAAKKGKLKKWIKKRKRTRQNKPEPKEMAESTGKTIHENQTEEIVLKVEKLGYGSSPFEKILGLITIYSQEMKKFVITGFTSDGPAKTVNINEGDILISVNNQILNLENSQKVLNEIRIFPSEAILKVEKRKTEDSKKKKQSSLVRSLMENSDEVETVLKNQPIAVAFVRVHDCNDLIYGFPLGSPLLSSRGSFVTLYHLLSLKKNICSSSVYYNNERITVLYFSEDEHLLFLALPKNRCDAKEASHIVADLLVCLRFNHRSLSEYFKSNSTSYLNHFFSVFFCRALTSGFSMDASRIITFEKLESKETIPLLFEDVLPYARWIQLPKRMQMQIDDALNQIEGNDIEYEEEDSVDFRRPYIITGSCLYHKGYLLASHFSKGHLSSIHSFCRQNGLIQLFRNEPVKSLVVWRKVYPPENHFRDSNDSFLLIVGQGYDAIVFLLESNSKYKNDSSSMVGYIEEAEDLLEYFKKMGVPRVASFCLANNFSAANKNETRGNLEPERRLEKKHDPTWKNRKIPHGDTSEDSASQAASNVSEISDENVPILGRRAERISAAFVTATTDESGNSDSDWDSFKESLTEDGGKSEHSLFLKSNKFVRSTSSTSDSLFHYVHLNGSEGILVTPNVNWNLIPSGMKKVVESFRKAALVIHSLLENNVRFKKSEGVSTTLVNKSLIAVKEHGLRLFCTTYDMENKKSCSFSYWVVGRLFFTPQRREIYVCHYGDAPQNLVETAFRLGLNASN